MPSNSENQQPGTQVLRRIGQILRFVAEHNRDGARLTDVAGALELEPPTAHRLLRGLVSERMIQFDEGSKRYRLGPELYELGLAAASRFDLIEFIAPSIQRLVEATGDSVVVTVRSGVEGVCVARRHGAFPIQTSVVRVGSRRPLSSGAGGLAIMSTLEEAKARSIAQANTGGERTRVATLLKRIREAQQLGYAVNEYRQPAPGIVALGVPICGTYGECIAGIAVVALGNRLSGKRRGEVVGLLKNEARLIQEELRAASSNVHNVEDDR